MCACLRSSNTTPTTGAPILILLPISAVPILGNIIGHGIRDNTSKVCSKHAQKYATAQCMTCGTSLFLTFLPIASSFLTFLSIEYIHHRPRYSFLLRRDLRSDQYKPRHRHNLSPSSLQDLPSCPLCPRNAQICQLFRCGILASLPCF